MARKKEPLKKHSIRLFDGDAEELDSLYPKLGYNKAVRYIVRRSIIQARSRRAAQTPIIDVEEDIEL